MRSRSWLWMVALCMLIGWAIWTRAALVEQAERVQLLRDDVNRIDAMQRYLPSLIRTTMAEHEARMLAAIDERLSHDRGDEGEGR